MNNRKLQNLLSMVLALCLVALYFPCGAAFAVTASDGTSDASSDREYVDSQIIVVYDNANDGSLSLQYADDGTTQALEDEGIVVEEQLASANVASGDIVLASVPDGKSVEDAVAEAQALDGVSWAQPNYVYELLDEEEQVSEGEFIKPLVDSVITPMLLPDDPAAQTYAQTTTANQYYLYGTTDSTKGANVIEAWDYATSDNAQTIAILDTGCNLSHEDLVDNLLSDLAYDVPNDKMLADEVTTSFNGDASGHGTHCCGLAAGRANNGVGIAGSSYNANVLPIKVFGDGTSPKADTANVVKGYQYVLDLIEEGKVSNLHVVSMSFGTYGELDSSDLALEKIIAQAREQGIITVCAGGNGDSKTTPKTAALYPSDFPESFSVTALNADGTNCVWSDYNMSKDISAPGKNLYSTYKSSSTSYKLMNGTSMAAPLVAGICALMWQARPMATVDRVVRALQSTADAIDDPDDAYNRWPEKTGSAGAINAAEAVSALLNPGIDSLSISSEPFAYVASGEDAQPLYLVTVSALLDDGSAPSFYGKVMFTDGKRWLGLATAEEAGVLTEDDVAIAESSSAIVTRGDVNQDGTIDIVDAQIALDASSALWSLSSTGLSDTQLLSADQNQDNVVDAQDARAIQVVVHAA